MRKEKQFQGNVSIEGERVPRRRTGPNTGIRDWFRFLESFSVNAPEGDRVSVRPPV